MVHLKPILPHVFLALRSGLYHFNTRHCWLDAVGWYQTGFDIFLSDKKLVATIAGMFCIQVPGVSKPAFCEHAIIVSHVFHFLKDT